MLYSFNGNTAGFFFLVILMKTTGVPLNQARDQCLDVWDEEEEEEEEEMERQFLIVSVAWVVVAVVALHHGIR